MIADGIYYHVLCLITIYSAALMYRRYDLEVTLTYYRNPPECEASAT